MAEKIRHIQQNEWDSFMRFLETSYGQALGFFMSHNPHLYRPDEACLDYFYVIEDKGKIVSHVGLFPLNAVADGVKITLGGIGSVATLPEERGKGYMGKLLLHVIPRMQELDMPLSVLWGNRQRYGNFGWELAGEKIVLNFNELSMTKAGIQPALSIQEVDPQRAATKVGLLYVNQRFWIERGKGLQRILCRSGNRVWIGDDGYLCGERAGDKLLVNEVVSLSGKETSFIMAVMERCFIKQAEITVCSQDDGYLDRLIKPAHGWYFQPEGEFRINNYIKLLKTFKSMLEERARALKVRRFSLSLGLRFSNKVDIATVRYKSGAMSISKRRTNPYIELDEREGVRLFIGGPFLGKERLGAFGALLPLPIHIPKLDTV